MAFKVPIKLEGVKHEPFSALAGDQIDPAFIAVSGLNVLTTVQPTPTATGNTTNLNTTFKDAAGDTWIVDAGGDAIKAASPAPPSGGVVYVNNVNANSATIFDLNNPPTVHAPALQANENYIFVGTDGSTWTYNSATSLYNTYIPAPSTEWVIAGSTTDAGASKTAAISRTGLVGLQSTAPFTPLSRLDDNGSLGVAVTETTAATYVATAEDVVIRLNAAVTQGVTLPTASTVTRRVYWLVNPTGTAKTVSPYTDFFGNTSTSIPAYGSIAVQSVGGVWKQFDGETYAAFGGGSTGVTGHGTLAVGTAVNTFFPNGIAVDGILFRNKVAFDTSNYYNLELQNNTGASVRIHHHVHNFGSEHEVYAQHDITVANGASVISDQGTIIYGSAALGSTAHWTVIVMNLAGTTIIGFYEVIATVRTFGTTRHSFVHVRKLF